MGLRPTKSEEGAADGWRGINDLRRVFSRAVLLSRDCGTAWPGPRKSPTLRYLSEVVASKKVLQRSAVALKSGVQTDESELIRAAQQGDHDAFEQLVRTYDQSVLRLAMNLLRSPEDAHDIYQEAFLRVFRNLNNFRFDCSFHTWLYRIVTNLCLDQMRKRKVRREEPSVMAGTDGQLDRMDSVAEERVDGDPHRHMFSGQLRIRVKQVLEGLTPRERMVFELRHYQGLRLKRIGEILGTTEEAAKNCLFRATQKMRTALGDFV